MKKLIKWYKKQRQWVRRGLLITIVSYILFILILLIIKLIGFSNLPLVIEAIILFYFLWSSILINFLIDLVRSALGYQSFNTIPLFITILNAIISIPISSFILGLIPDLLKAFKKWWKRLKYSQKIIIIVLCVLILIVVIIVGSIPFPYGSNSKFAESINKVALGGNGNSSICPEELSTKLSKQETITSCTKEGTIKVGDETIGIWNVEIITDAGEVDIGLYMSFKRVYTFFERDIDNKRVFYRMNEISLKPKYSDKIQEAVFNINDRGTSNISADFTCTLWGPSIPIGVDKILDYSTSLEKVGKDIYAKIKINEFVDEKGCSISGLVNINIVTGEVKSDLTAYLIQDGVLKGYYLGIIREYLREKGFLKTQQELYGESESIYITPDRLILYGPDKS